MLDSSAHGFSCAKNYVQMITCPTLEDPSAAEADECG
jgi:hypothetical protein